MEMERAPDGRLGTAGAAVSVAIFGSCVSRDAFGRAPQDLGFALPVTAMRSSLFSVGAPPAPRAAITFGDGLRAFERRCVEMDLDKSFFDRLAAARPDWLVVDLIDERFDLALGDEGWIATLSKSLREGSDFEKGPAVKWAPVRRGWPGVRESLPRAAAAFMSRVLATMPAHRVIVHRAYWAERELDASGAPRDSDEAAARKAREHNAYLETGYDALLAAVPGAQALDVDPALRVSDPAHGWGQAPFHYGTGYYAAFLEALREIVRRDAPGAATADTARVEAAAEPELAALLARAFGGEHDLGLKLARTLLCEGLFGLRPRVARALFVSAALGGAPAAGPELGRMTLTGAGLAQDRGVGLSWMRQAERRASKEAYAALGALHAAGGPYAHDPPKALAYLRRAAQAGDWASAQAMAGIYESGMLEGGVDDARAVHWRKVARRIEETVLGYPAALPSGPATA